MIKVLKIVMLVPVMACVLSVQAEVIRSETANGYTWMYELRSGGAWIAGVEGRPSGSVTVPATLGGKPVKFIVFPVCSEPPVPYDILDLSRVTSITFPDTLKVIGGQLFKDSALQTFKLPASLIQGDENN